MGPFGGGQRNFFSPTPAQPFARVPSPPLHELVPARVDLRDLLHGPLQPQRRLQRDHDALRPEQGAVRDDRHRRLLDLRAVRHVQRAAGRPLRRRRAILFGALGTAVFNLVIGLLFLAGWQTKIVVGMSLLYAVNQYFQSFGALSVVKVNAPWFHVRGARRVRRHLRHHDLLRLLPGDDRRRLDPGLPALVLGVPDPLGRRRGDVRWSTISWSRTPPEQAGFPDLDTGDATSADADRDKPVDFAPPRHARLHEPG